ncbi:unnamed protein product [Aphanomyces euteiches]
MAAYPRAKLPLPLDYFRCPPISPVVQSTLIQQGFQAIKDVLMDCQLDGGSPTKWTLDSTSNGVSTFLGSANPFFPKATAILTSTTVKASLAQAAATFKMDTREDYVTHCATFYPEVIDAASLYTLAAPTPEHPRNYIGVKWMAVESPSSLMKPRDFCLLEFHDDFTVKGAPGWARVYQSAFLPNACPELNEACDLVRGRILRAGFVFVEIPHRPGFLQFMHVLHIDFCGSSPQWLVKKGLKRRANITARIRDFLHRNFMQTQPLWSPEREEPELIVQLGTSRSLNTTRSANTGKNAPPPAQIAQDATSSGTVINVLLMTLTIHVEASDEEDETYQRAAARSRSLRDTFTRIKSPVINEPVRRRSGPGPVNWQDIENVTCRASKEQLRNLYKKLKAMRLDESFTSTNLSVEVASNCATAGRDV